MMRYFLLALLILIPWSGWADDSVLDWFASSCTVTESPETSCSDTIDNDCDGLTDSADSDCGGVNTPYDAVLTFADGTQIATAFKVCIDSEAGVVLACSSEGTVVNNSTVTVTFTGASALATGTTYITSLRTNGGTGTSGPVTVATITDGSLGLQYQTSAGTYASPGNYDPATSTWVANSAMKLAVRNSTGTTLLGIASGTAGTATTVYGDNRVYLNYGEVY